MLFDRIHRRRGAAQRRSLPRPWPDIVPSAARQTPGFSADAWRLDQAILSLSEEKGASPGFFWRRSWVLNLANVYVHVRINQWSAAEYNALGMYNSVEFIHQFYIFLVLSAFNIIITVYALYLNQMLQIRWRRWLTRRYIATWRTHRPHLFPSAALRRTGRQSRSAHPGRSQPFHHLCDEPVAWPDDGGGVAVLVPVHPVGIVGSRRNSARHSGALGTFPVIWFGPHCSIPASAPGSASRSGGR